MSPINSVLKVRTTWSAGVTKVTLSTTPDTTQGRSTLAMVDQICCLFGRERFIPCKLNCPIVLPIFQESSPSEASCSHSDGVNHLSRTYYVNKSVGTAIHSRTLTWRETAFSFILSFDLREYPVVIVLV